MLKNLLQGFFSPRSIAIVGASDKDGKVGTVIAKNILKLGYGGEIFLVNNSYQQLYDKKCYASLNDIEKDIELAIIVVPAKFVNAVILESCQKIKNFVVISAGFGEIGKDGLQRENELRKIAQENELNILGPNCLGFIVPSLNLNASFAGGMPKSGNIAFISQSGALAVALMDIASEKNLAFSSIISVGNKMQIDESQLLEFYAKDKGTKVIAMYLEGIKDGIKFLEVARRVAKIKPIVILKTGKNQKSQQAISSHTGALAGSDAIADVVFQEAGILRAENLQHFFDLITLISAFDAPLNNKVGVITNAGGAGVLTTDAFENKKVELYDFNEKQQLEILRNLPQESSAHNPVDLLGDAREDRYKSILNILEKNKEIGSILAILTPQDQTPVAEIAKEIILARKKNKKIIVTSFVGGARVSKEITELADNGVPNFAFPERAVEALSFYAKWKEQKDRKSLTGYGIKINNKRVNKVSDIIQRARTQNRKALYYCEACDIMKLYDIPVAQAFTILPKQNIPTGISYPVVLKIDSDTVLHKSDKQALIVGIENEKDLLKGLGQLRKNFPLERFIIQFMCDKQSEIILGIKKDENFGNVIVYGLGGIYTEIFKKVNFLIPPMEIKQIVESLKTGPLGFMFEITRGQKAYNANEFAQIIVGLMEFSKEIPEIKEFDINPLFLYNDKRKAVAVDVKIIF